MRGGGGRGRVTWDRQMKNGAIEPVARVTWMRWGGGVAVKREGNSRQKQREANEPESA